MGGDSFRCLSTTPDPGLNPPRPHGRGRYTYTRAAAGERLKSTPPAWAGTEYAVYVEKGTSLNPPRPHGRGQQTSDKIATDMQLKSTPPAWAGTICNCRMFYGKRA